MHHQSVSLPWLELGDWQLTGRLPCRAYPVLTEPVLARPVSTLHAQQRSDNLFGARHLITRPAFFSQHGASGALHMSQAGYCHLHVVRTQT